VTDTLTPAPTQYNWLWLDIDWCRVHLPKFASCLSHRVFDVSVLKAAEWRQAVGL